MRMPKLSVIVPIYNSDKYLKKCLDSILGQSFTDFEIIAVNDGSFDNSVEILRNYQEEDSRIRIISQKNQGLSAARNTGLNHVLGEYVSFIDSDDWIDSNMFRDLIFDLESNESDIVACNISIFKSDYDIKEFNKNSYSRVFNREEAMGIIYTNNMLTYSACNKIYKSHLFKNLRFTVGIIYEDIDFTYKLINLCKKVNYINKSYYYYRFTDNSILRRKFNLKRLDEYKVKFEMYEFYEKFYPSFSSRVYYNLFETGVNLYINLIFYHFDLTNYQYLVSFDKRILIKNIFDPKINLTRKLRVFLFLCSKKVLYSLLIFIKNIQGKF